jgi:SAM-dependent methyltransferase
MENYLPEIQRAAESGPIIDLACGNGRNGLYLLTQNIPVIFSDINPAALDRVRSSRSYKDNNSLAKLRLADFEGDQPNPLTDKQFGGIIIFRYLHRPLLATIKESIAPGGIVIYETFTVDQVKFGRPKNRDFLLRHRELYEYFSDWDVLHYFEGEVNEDLENAPSAIAQAVAIKPEGLRGQFT